MTAVAESTSPPEAAPRQRSKPLLPVRGVCSLLDKDEDWVLRAVEEGELPWAWDVALNPKRARCKELRILPACVVDYMRGNAPSLEWADVLRLLLPHDGPVILSKDITRILNISGEQTYNFAREKVIPPCSSWHPGRGGCARFAAKSFIEFLQTRRFP